MTAARHRVDPRIEPGHALSEVLAAPPAGVVDELHLAAMLESRGVTDDSVRRRFAYDDVFTLAECALPQVPPVRSVPAPRRVPGRRRTLWTVTHGVLYLAPSAAYPALWLALGAGATTRGMVAATALGWVWGIVTSGLAYQMRARQDEAAVGRVHRTFTLLGLALAAAVGSVIAWQGRFGPAVVAFVVLQLLYQLAVGVLTFHHREDLLALSVAPAVAMGLAFLLLGRPASLVTVTVSCAVACTALAALAAWHADGRGVVLRPVLPDHGRSLVTRSVAPGAAYAGLCATLLLFTDARYLTGRLDLAVAAAPLVVGMGVLEWRAQHFVDDAARMVDRATSIESVRSAAWRLMLRELLGCALALTALAAVLLGALRVVGALTLTGAVLVDAHVVLGCALYVGFLVMRHRRAGRAVAGVACVVAADVAAVGLGIGHLPPDGEVFVFLATAAALLSVLLVAFRAGTRRLYDFCW